MTLKYLLIILIGYFIGCSHMSFYISKARKLDIKSNGSKNYGAANTFKLAGKKAGILVFFHDALKSVLASLIARIFFKDILYADVICGIAAIVGHIFPCYLKFNGGKGFASLIGLMLYLNPLISAIVIVVSLGFALASNYLVTATFTCAIATPIIVLCTRDWKAAAIVSISTILIFIKHKQNIVNLVTKNGQEAKLRSSLAQKKGDLE